MESDKDWPSGLPFIFKVTFLSYALIKFEYHTDGINHTSTLHPGHFPLIYRNSGKDNTADSAEFSGPTCLSRISQLPRSPWLDGMRSSHEVVRGEIGGEHANQIASSFIFLNRTAVDSSIKGSSDPGPPRGTLGGSNFEECLQPWGTWSVLGRLLWTGRGPLTVLSQGSR